MNKPKWLELLILWGGAAAVGMIGGLVLGIGIRAVRWVSGDGP